MDQRNQFKKYIIHVFFRVFAQGLFFTFGALLLYVKTESIFWVLLFGLIMSLVSGLVRSIWLKGYFKFLSRFGIRISLGLGLFLTGLSYTILFFINNDTSYFYYIFIVTAVFQGLGNGFYWTPSTALKLYLSGITDAPGKFISYVNIARSITTLLAAAIGLIFNAQGNFILIFLISTLALIISYIPLRGIREFKIQQLSLSACLKKISIQAFLANINPTGTFHRMAVPLVIFLLVGTISRSAWITGITAIGSIIATYFTGRLKDRHKVWLNTIALISLPVVWILYGFIDQPAQFIFLGITFSILSTIMTTGGGARLSREVSNSHSPFEATVAVELARSIGGTLAYVILLMSLLIVGVLDQRVLILGALLTIPAALYSLGNIAKKI